MYKKSLKDSISISELRYMRDVEGLSNREIANRLDIAPCTVGRYLGPANPEITSKARRNNCTKRLTPEQIEEICTLHKQGRNVNEIAKRLGVAWTTVRSRLKSMELNKKTLDQPPAKPEPKPEVPVTQPQKQEGEQPMLQIISRRQTIRMKGSECQYLMELGSGTDTVTIMNGDGQEVAVFDAEGLASFMGELGRILRSLKDAAAA